MVFLRFSKLKKVQKSDFFGKKWYRKHIKKMESEKKYYF